MPRNTEGGHREPTHVHTSPATQRPARGAETSAPKPLDAEGVPGTPPPVLTSLRHRGWTSGTESSAHESRDTEGELRG